MACAWTNKRNAVEVCEFNGRTFMFFSGGDLYSIEKNFVDAPFYEGNISATFPTGFNNAYQLNGNLYVEDGSAYYKYVGAGSFSLASTMDGVAVPWSDNGRDAQSFTQADGTFLMMSGGQVWSTSDFISWTLLPVPASLATGVSPVSICKFGSRYIASVYRDFTAGTGAIFYYSDNLTSWTPCTGITDLQSSYNQVTFVAQGGAVYAVRDADSSVNSPTNNLTVYRSTNGSSFSTIHSNGASDYDGGAYINCLVGDGVSAIVAVPQHSYVDISRTNNGTSWSVTSSGFPFTGTTQQQYKYYGVIYTGAKFVLGLQFPFGAPSTFTTSSDTTTWVEYPYMAALPSREPDYIVAVL